MKKVIISTASIGLFVLSLLFVSNPSQSTFDENAFAGTPSCCPELYSYCFYGGLQHSDSFYNDEGCCTKTLPGDPPCIEQQTF